MSTVVGRVHERHRRLGGVPLLGRVCAWAGLLGAVSGLVLAAWPASVEEDRYSYPLGAAAFAVVQCWFVAQHLGLLAGLVGLRRSSAASSRSFHVGAGVAALGMVLLAATELLAVGAAGSSTEVALAKELDALYGTSTVAIGLGLLIAGVAVLRAGAWQGRRRWLPLALGAYVFVPMTPLIAAGFLAARLGITGWMLLFALLGWVLASEGRS